ncbi:MAG: MFS transporter [Gammaproteobacteria bacterium]|nr:MFS transporter [Gammaproteobacteria bacterium]
MTTEVSGDSKNSTRRVIGLISAGHFLSHFYLLLLPPLFPLLRDVYGVGYTQLGLAITAFSVVTALTQAPIGFLVDRYGARTILVAGILLEAIAFIGIGIWPVYGALIGFMMLAGLANSVYHPADYAILNASVDPARMGRAFSIHTFAGYLGNATAPVTMIFLASLFDWRVGVIVCGAFGGVVGVLIALNSSVLRDAAPASSGGSAEADGTGRRGMALLFSGPVMLGLLFFVGIAITGGGFSGFTVAVLDALRGMDLKDAGFVLSVFLFAGPVGVLSGGWVADRIAHHARFTAVCFVLVACAAVLIATVELPYALLVIVFMLAGFFSGAVAPSRDMMIRALAPPGEMGKVFGFVSTGFNIGSMVAPVLFGYLLDQSQPQGVFWVVAVVSLLTVGTVLATGGRPSRAVTPARA